MPEIDGDRPLRTADISVFTTKDVRDAVKCHLNLVVHDTITWEQSAAYILEHHPAVRSFVKNFGLNFTVPYLHNGKPSDYLPDFVIRLASDEPRYLVVEIKGNDWDATAEVKAQAAHRWCAAVNATKRFGSWDYLLVNRISDLHPALDAVLLPQAAE